MQQTKKKSRGFSFGSTSTMLVGSLTMIMLVLWYIMHSMVVIPPTSQSQASSSSSQSSQPQISNIQKSMRGTPTQQKGNYFMQSISQQKPSLTANDVSLLNSALGERASNFTTGVFITIPDWITHDPEAGIPPPPCLYAKQTGYNVYLFEEGWRDASAVEEGSSTQCPLPKGGQLPLSKEEIPQISIILAFRNMASDTIRSIISILNCARQVDSIEILILDIASK